MPGALVAVEGIDGSGLTTHSRLLAARLNSMGVKAAYTKEPTAGPVGQLIRQLLSSGAADPRVMALLFAADRLWHLSLDPTLPGGQGIEGALRAGYVVVTDRYKYSSIAYQGALGAEDGWLWKINDQAREADIIVYIDVPLEVAILRLAERESREAYERVEILRIVKEHFEAVLSEAASRGVKVIRVKGAGPSGPRTIDEVADEILSEVSKVLGPHYKAF